MNRYARMKLVAATIAKLPSEIKHDGICYHLQVWSSGLGCYAGYVNSRRGMKLVESMRLPGFLHLALSDIQTKLNLF